MLKNVTVEPTMFFFVISGILTILTSQNLSLEKACRVNLNYSDEICDSLRLQSIEGQSEYEREVQLLITRAMSWKTYITATVPCVLALFVGSWSDKTGYRKIFILIPIVGNTLVCINGALQTYFLRELRLEHLVFIEGIIEGFSGHWCVCFLILFAYISAITTDKNRTFRMGLINFSFTVGFPIGMGFSGILIKKWGFYGGYGTAGALNIFNILLNTVYLKDPKRTVEQLKNTGKGMGHLVRCFFDLTNIKETVEVVLKKGANSRRTRIIVLLAVTAILFGPMHGEISILYISTRYRFSWDEVNFSLFQTYNFITHTIGTIFSITYFSKYLQWHDSVLGIISTVSKILASFIYCFAPNEKIFFIAPLVDILNGTSLLALRSTVSKLVEVDELGKVNSIFALTENLMPLIYIPLYTKVYAATMEVLPGAAFLMGAAMTIPAVVVFIFLFYEHRKQINRDKDEEEDTTKET
ncbi:lysosomal proton-coupled steroid conjugate and bile acid symporter SLC46A3-like [Epargyreus clarus]|uniref:lysosomal proton-coupled steroid conjugate and bile acid symporter SLC46A3-like n=1 Tax=Epargyreus clarus TaxID=520877 RepID=UPI003C2FB031